MHKENIILVTTRSVTLPARAAIVTMKDGLIECTVYGKSSRADEISKKSDKGLSPFESQAEQNGKT